MRSADEGLVATLYAPCEVSTTLGGRKVHMLEETDYPFCETIRITVTPETAHTAFH